MSQITNPDPDLMRIFNFTADDLEANRAGHLSERQIKKLSELKQQTQWLAGGGCIVVIVFVLLTFGNGLSTSMKNSSISILSILGVIALTIIIFMSLGTMDRDADLRRNKPKIYVGHLYLSLQYGKFGPIYRIFTSDVDIKISALAYNLFDHYLYTNGKEIIFRLYYAPNSNELLSLEVVEQSK